VEVGGYGIDFTHHGATGYRDAEAADAILRFNGLKTTFRQDPPAGSSGLRPGARVTGW
jgi:hypothetical protein